MTEKKTAPPSGFSTSPLSPFRDHIGERLYQFIVENPDIQAFLVDEKNRVRETLGSSPRMQFSGEDMIGKDLDEELGIGTVLGPDWVTRGQAVSQRISLRGRHGIRQPVLLQGLPFDQGAAGEAGALVLLQFEETLGPDASGFTPLGDPLGRVNLELLLRGAQVILQERVFPRVCAELLGTLLDEMQVEAGYLSFWDPEARRVRVWVRSDGGSPHELDSPDFEPRKEFMESVLGDLDYVILDDEHDPRVHELLSAGHRELKTLLVIRIPYAPQQISFLALANKPGGFNSQDLALPMSFAWLFKLALDRYEFMADRERLERHYRTIVEQIREGIAVVREGRIVFFNPGFMTLAGTSRGDLQGKMLAEVFNVAEDSPGNLENLSPGSGLSSPLLIRTRDKNGVDMDIEIRHREMDWERRPALLLVLRDVTQEQAAARAMEDALREAIRAKALRTHFLQNISHEIRTPLNGILGFAELIMGTLDEHMNAQHRMYLDLLKYNSERLIRTMDEITNISDLESGQVKPNFGPLHLSTLVAARVNLIQPRCAEKGIALNVEENSQDDVVLADTDHLSSILDHLLQNALKFTESGSITVEILDGQESPQIRITDTGIGMSAEYVKRLYEPFSQYSEGIARRFQGLGLGLAIVHKYAELNRIRMEVESEPEQGTSILLIFRPMGGKNGEEERPDPHPGG